MVIHGDLIIPEPKHGTNPGGVAILEPHHYARTTFQTLNTALRTQAG